VDTRSALPRFEQALSEVSTALNRMRGQSDVLHATLTDAAAAAYLGALGDWLGDCAKVQQGLAAFTARLEAGPGLPGDTAPGPLARTPS